MCLRTIRLGFKASSVIPPRRRPSATNMSFAFNEWVVHHSMGKEEVVIYCCRTLSTQQPLPILLIYKITVLQLIAAMIINCNKQIAWETYHEVHWIRSCLLCFLAGHPALIGRHDPYAVTKEAEARWLDHMEPALDDIHEIDSKSHLFNFFKSKLFLAHDVSKLMYVSLHHFCVCFAD